MPYTPARADWHDLPSRATPVRAQDLEHIEAGVADAVSKAEEALANPGSLTDDQAEVIESAARVVAGVLVDPAGDPVPLGDVTDEQITAAVEGAASLDLPAGTTINGASPASFTMDKDAGKVFFATGVEGEFLMFEGGTIVMGDGGDDFDPADITYEWGNATRPTSATNWPDTIGGVDASFGLDLNGGSAYDAAAFAGHGGLKLFNDGLAAHLSAPITLDVETGWGCAYSVIQDFGTDAGGDGAEVILFALQDDGRVPPVCRVMFRMTEAGPGDGSGKAYAWVVEAAGQPEMVVAVGSLTGLDSSGQVVNAIHSVALHFKGSASYLAVDGIQKGATIDLTGLDGVTYLDLNPHSGEGALLRGFQTIGSFGLTDDTMTEAETKAWVADRRAALVV